MAKGTGVADNPNQDNMTISEKNKELSEHKNIWEYSTEGSENSVVKSVNDSFEDIKWSASEYIAYDKNITWYLALTVIIVILAAVVYLLTRDILSTFVIILAGGVMGFYAGRKPRVLTYKLDRSGFTIQDKVFSYDSFKSFAVMDKGVMPNIILIHLKRFMPSLTIYLDPGSEEEVLKVLADRLPEDIHHTDIVDRFFQHIRF